MGDKSNPTYPGAKPVVLPEDSQHIQELLFPTQQKAGTYNGYLPGQQTSLNRPASRLDEIFGLDPNRPRVVQSAALRGLGGAYKTLYPQEGGGFGPVPFQPQPVVDKSKPNVNPAYAQFADYATALLNPQLFRREY